MHKLQQNIWKTNKLHFKAFYLVELEPKARLSKKFTTDSLHMTADGAAFDLQLSESF